VVTTVEICSIKRREKESNAGVFSKANIPNKIRPVFFEVLSTPQVGPVTGGIPQFLQSTCHRAETVRWLAKRTASKWAFRLRRGKEQASGLSESFKTTSLYGFPSICFLENPDFGRDLSHAH